MHARPIPRTLTFAVFAALVLALVPLSLGQSSGEPATAGAPQQTAGTIENWTFAFQLTVDVPANGSFLVDLPDGFGLTSGASCAIVEPSNVSAVTEVVGPQTVSCHVADNASIANGTTIRLEVDGVRDPSTAGDTGTFRIDVHDDNATTAALATHEAPSQHIDPHAFAGGPVRSNPDYRAGRVQTHTFDFTLYNAWESDGRLELAFPSGYDIDAGGQATSQATFTGGADGSLERVTASGTTLAFQRTGGSVVAGGTSVTVEVTQIRNPSTEGWTSPFTVRTMTAAGGVHDEGQANGVYITTTATQTPPPSPTASPSPEPSPSPSPSPSPTANQTSPTPAEEPAGEPLGDNDTSGGAPRNWNLGNDGPGGASPAVPVAAVFVALGVVGAAVAWKRNKSV